MKCMYCQGQMVKTTAPFSMSRKGYHIHWDSIPAYVCSQCGESYFEGEAVDKIQNTLSTLDKETEELINV